MICEHMMCADALLHGALTSCVILLSLCIVFVLWRLSPSYHLIINVNCSHV